MRLVLHAAALLAGLAAGVLGSFAHRLHLSVLPWGLLVALILTAAVLAASGRALRSRTGAWAAALGWVLAVFQLAAPRPEGDLVVTGNSWGSIWLVGGALLAVVTATRTYAPPPQPPDPAAGS